MANKTVRCVVVGVIKMTFWRWFDRTGNAVNIARAQEVDDRGNKMTGNDLSTLLFGEDKTMLLFDVTSI
jgi:hypothetical protein